MHPLTRRSPERALLTSGTYQLDEPGACEDEAGDWADPAALAARPPAFPAAPWLPPVGRRRAGGRQAGPIVISARLA